MPGTESMVCLVVSCSRPAIIMAPPEGSSTVVSARRTLSAGITSEGLPAPLDRVKAPSVDSSDTSVDSFSEI